MNRGIVIKIKIVSENENISSIFSFHQKREWMNFELLLKTNTKLIATTTNTQHKACTNLSQLSAALC